MLHLFAFPNGRTIKYARSPSRVRGRQLSRNKGAFVLALVMYIKRYLLHSLKVHLCILCIVMFICPAPVAKCFVGCHSRSKAYLHFLQDRIIVICQQQYIRLLLLLLCNSSSIKTW
ncbi:hypothetical protein FKM82_011500 [Ascaphus truei]